MGIKKPATEKLAGFFVFWTGDSFNDDGFLNFLSDSRSIPFFSD